MFDLTSDYLGLRLRSPVILGASPVAGDLEAARAAVQAGAGAVVMYSLFEEQIIQASRALDAQLEHGAEVFAEATSYLPDMQVYKDVGPEGYLQQLRDLKEALDVPVIGSLNGISAGGWLDYAEAIEEAGADALELNCYRVSADPGEGSAPIEDELVALIEQVTSKVSIPVAVKLSPFYTGLPSVAARLVAAGAKGLVCFNRFYQPDLDLEELEVTPALELSDSRELRLPLRWTAILASQLEADLALSSGVHSGQDALKAIAAGAAVAQTVSAVLRGGPQVIAGMLADMRAWLEEKEYDSLDTLRGSMSQQAVEDPNRYERANYVKVLASYSSSTV